MRRKLGTLILTAVTVLAGTQEAMRQFDGLRSSLNDLTRASLWSGLIVYAQPVADGKLPAPQIYYLTPQPQIAPPNAPQQPVLADNNSDNNSDANAAKAETKNHHVAEELAQAETHELLPPSLPPAREIEDAAMSELALDKLPVHVFTAHPPAAPKLDKARIYEEVARNVPVARKLRQEADMIARGFVKELDAAKLEAELARIAATHEQLETAKLKSLPDAEAFTHRLQLKVIRRPAPPEQRHERIRVVAPRVIRRAIAPLPEMSSIGCEKTITDASDANEAKPAAVVKANVAPSGIAKSVSIVSEPHVLGEPTLPIAAPLPSSTSWALGCDTEPEFK